MFIGIDGNEANTKLRVGSNVYAHRILQGIHDTDQTFNYQIYLKSPPQKHLPSANHRWHYRHFGPGKLWTQWRLPLDLYFHKPRPSLYFTPGHYAPRFSPIPTAISIMDLAFLSFPETFKPSVLRQLTSWTKYSVMAASHIFAISHHTKKDLLKHYQVSPDKITVTHLGTNLKKPDDWSLSEKTKVMSKYQIPGRYFIFVGTRQPRKNLDTLIKAFNRVHANERNIFLVIAGKTWHQFTDSSLQVSSNVITTGFVPNSDLAKLILGAEALVLPSLYEGFGIPVLEAMSLGTLATASNTSSIPEITGDSPLLFDPTNDKAIAATLTQILHLSPEKRKKLIREGKIKAKNFSWENCTRQTLKVLHHLCLEPSADYN